MSKTQSRVFWIMVVIAITLTVLVGTAIYNIKPDPKSTGPYQGAKTAAKFIIVLSSLGIITSVIMKLTDKTGKEPPPIPHTPVYHVKHKKHHR